MSLPSKQVSFFFFIHTCSLHHIYFLLTIDPSISRNTDDQSIIPIATHFITSQGRMKFVRPLYRALFQSEMGKEIAKKTFVEHYNFYHPIAAKMLASDLGVSQPSPALEEESSESKEVSKSDIDKMDETKNEVQKGGNPKKRSIHMAYAGVGLSILTGVGLVFLRQRR